MPEYFESDLKKRSRHYRVSRFDFCETSPHLPLAPVWRRPQCDGRNQPSAISLLLC
jgi:hypothetical protein